MRCVAFFLRAVSDGMDQFSFFSSSSSALFQLHRTCIDYVCDNTSISLESVTEYQNRMDYKDVGSSKYHMMSLIITPE
jgi:hypothetical protein